MAIGFAHPPLSPRSISARPLATTTNFWQNLQFDLALAGGAGRRRLGADPAARPRWRADPIVWAGLFLVVLALSPLLALTDTLVRPLAKSQYVARTAGGPGHRHHRHLHLALRARRLARQVGARSSPCAGPKRARRFLAFALSHRCWRSCPSDIYLTQDLDAVTSTPCERSCAAQQGVIAFESHAAVAASARPRWSRPGSCPARAWCCAPSAATASSRRPAISTPGSRSRRPNPIRSAHYMWRD